VCDFNSEKISCADRRFFWNFELKLEMNKDHYRAEFAIEGKKIPFLIDKSTKSLPHGL
jgi:hypothetical protein